MRIFILLLMVGGLFLAGCCEEKEPVRGFNLEFMVFGHFYGECGGESCVEMFKIEDGKLYEDTLDTYPGSTTAYLGQWVELSDESFEEVKDILEEIPKMLLHETGTVIGMPDAGDWGGIYVQVQVPEQSISNRFWLLDQHEGNMPQVYNDFVDKINAKIALINQ